MSPVRGPVVKESDTFQNDLDRLEDGFPQLNEVLERFKDTLRLGYDLPHVHAAPEDYVEDFPDVHAKFLDYPPAGADGKKALLILYHHNDERDGSPMQAASSTFTLLSITDDT